MVAESIKKVAVNFKFYRLLQYTMATTIQLEKKTKSKLNKMKIFPKESYDDVVNRLIYVAEDDEGVLSTSTIKDLEEALDDVKKGRLLSHSQVKKKLGL